MRGASAVVKMSLMVVAISLAVVHMKIDAFCEHTTGASGTQTHTGVSDGMFGNIFSGGNMKVSTIGALVALSLSYLMTKSTVNAEVTKAPLNYDDVNQTTVRAEAESYLQQQIQLQNDAQKVNNTQVTENIVGKYVPPAVEESAQWQLQDDYDDYPVSDYDDDEAHERVERSAQHGEHEASLAQCYKYEKQMVRRFADQILEGVDNNNSTIVLKAGENKKMQKKLQQIDTNCHVDPVEYVGPIIVDGEETGEHVYTITHLDRLGKVAEEFRKPATISPSNSGNDGSISVSDGTNVNHNVSPAINKVTTPSTDSDIETTDNPECKTMEKELLRKYARNIVPQLAYNISVFHFDAAETRRLKKDLTSMEELDCHRMPLKYSRATYTHGKNKPTGYKYTIGDDISLNSLREQLDLDVIPTTVMPTEDPICETKRHEMAKLVAKPLRNALKNDEETFEVSDENSKRKLDAVNREMTDLHCNLPLEYEPEAESDKEFSINIIDEVFVRKWEDDRKAQKKARKQNQGNSTSLNSDETSETINEDNNIDRPQRTKCTRTADKLLEEMESEVDQALSENDNVVRVTRDKETKIKSLLEKMTENGCDSPVEIKKEKLGKLPKLMRLKIVNKPYLEDFVDRSDESAELYFANTSARPLTTTPTPVTTTQKTTTRKSRPVPGTQEFCDDQGKNIVKLVAPKVRSAIERGENFITLDTESQAGMDVGLNSMPGCSKLPFTNGRIEGRLWNKKLKYDFDKADLQRKYPDIVGPYLPDVLAQARDTILQVVEGSQEEGRENNDNSASSEKTTLAQISLDDDSIAHSTTTQSITMNPICDQILSETVDEFEGAFKSMFNNGRTNLKLHSKPGNNLLRRENELMSNDCPNPFHMSDAEYKGHNLRLTFDVKGEDFIASARNRVLHSDQ